MTTNIAVLDAFFGDNGKGRCSNDFSPNFDYVIRFNGSNNAGHVVYRDGIKYNHHLLPCADYRNKNTKSFLANGMVISPEKLLEEVLEMEQSFPGVAKTIIVDPDVFVVLPEHIERDKAENKHLGTTSQGVGPAYTDKVARKGVRFYNLINDNNETIQTLSKMGVRFIPELKLREIFKKSNLLFEGAQSILLDINCSIYPYCTSSDTTISGAYACGFHWVKFDKVYGAIKPYGTKSGAGPLPTEMSDEDAKIIRELGGEYGNTTKRARRISYLDLPAIRYAVKKGGITNLIINKMDILSKQKSIKVCHSYGKEEEIYSPNDFNDAKPDYINLPGWNNAKNIDQVLPFLKYVESFVGIPVDYIGVGVNKEDLIKIEKKNK